MRRRRVRADGDEPVVAARHSSTACHSGDSSDTGCEPVGQPADREERAREQEQREHADAHDRPRTAASLSCVDRVRRQRRRERRARRAPRPGSRARPTTTARRRASRRRRGTPSPTSARGGTVHEQRARRTASPALDRRRHRGVVRAHPLHAAEHRPQRLARRLHHRARGHEPGRDELEVVDAVDAARALVDEVAEPECPSRRGTAAARTSTGTPTPSTAGATPPIPARRPRTPASVATVSPRACGR